MNRLSLLLGYELYRFKKFEMQFDLTLSTPFTYWNLASSMCMLSIFRSEICCLNVIAGIDYDVWYAHDTRMIHASAKRSRYDDMAVAQAGVLTRIWAPTSARTFGTQSCCHYDSCVDGYVACWPGGGGGGGDPKYFGKGKNFGKKRVEKKKKI